MKSRTLIVLIGLLALSASAFLITGQLTGMNSALADRLAAGGFQQVSVSPLAPPIDTDAGQMRQETETTVSAENASSLATPANVYARPTATAPVMDSPLSPLFVATPVFMVGASEDAIDAATAVGSATTTLTSTVRPPAASTPTATFGPDSPLFAPVFTPVVYTYQVVNDYPHDPGAFTQGLVYVDGILYEGTGLNGQSSLRKVDLVSGEVIEKIALPDAYFGEGVAVMDGQVYQLTWKHQKGFVYDADDLSKTGEFTYATEGWGLTHDGKRLIMSDGSSTLYFRDPKTFAELGRVQVTGPNGPMDRLNELEYINGYVFANIWQTDYIVRIDPQTGQIVGVIDLTGLLKQDHRTGRVDVLNGIAYDPAGKRLFVTGKLWPRLYQIELKVK